ncbi:MAG: uracil-DNA glycosylase family protein [Gammaproteobacteria bacterium]
MNVSHLSPQQERYLQLMGIDVWVERKSGPPATQDSVLPGHAGPDKSMADVPDNPVWESLRQQVSLCTRCGLHSGRTQTVFGVGDVHADWLLIGEAPGAEEDRLGEPFVGRAGKLLNSMLEAIGLNRQQVFIANILKCRPPKNRDPRPEEVSACESYLRQQITLISPKIILALGRIAAQNLLKTDTPIGRMRGRHYEFPDPRVPVVVTYHPAYLLRSPREKRKSWQDLQLAMRIYKEAL